MTISFTSTYGFSLKQLKTKASAKDLEVLKSIAGRYGGFFPAVGKKAKAQACKLPDGSLKYYDAGFSTSQKNDKHVKQELDKLGILPYDVVEIHRVPTDKIADALGYKGTYSQFNPINIANKIADKNAPKLNAQTIEMKESMELHGVTHYDDIDVHIPGK